LNVEDLPPPTSRTAWTRPEGRAGSARRPTPKPRSTTVTVPGQPIPLAAASREVATAREALAARGMEAFRDACNGFGLARVALEMAALAHHRGGLVEGERDMSATMIAAAIVRSLEPDGRTDERVRAEVRAVLRLCVSEDWIAEEWEGKAKDCSILQRFRLASQMSAARTLTRRSDPRYTYTLKRLSKEWGATREEVLALSLRSLAPSASRRMVDRRAAGAMDREAYLTSARQGAAEVARLVAAGMGLRAISRALGVSVSKARRLMALSPEQVAAATPTLAAASSVAGKSRANAHEPIPERMVA
jgi:hypothetical protein